MKKYKDNKSTYGKTTTPDGKPSNVSDSFAHWQSKDDVGVIVSLKDWWISVTTKRK